MPKDVENVMEKFNSIYLFTTENIAGYMHDLDLTGTKVITVTGSTDHLINIALLGSKDITTFDINPLAKPYMDLKLSALKTLSFKEFLDFLLYDTSSSFSYDIITSLKMPADSKSFWLKRLSEWNNGGLALKKSPLFNRKYYNPASKISQNLYLDEKNYQKVQFLLSDVSISFINSSLESLELIESYDYMFLSNISDYISLMYRENGLMHYRDLMSKFLDKVKQIYMAYLYDIGNPSPRSEIDDLDKINQLFKNYEIKKFTSALEKAEDASDGVIILRRVLK